MANSAWFVIFVVLVSFVFDFINVFHDSANSISTIVSTLVLSLRNAVVALGIMAGGWRIVKTMGTKITKIQPMVGFCAGTAAVISNRGILCRYTRENDPYDYRRYHGGRDDKKAYRRALEDHRKHLTKKICCLYYETL